MDERSEEEIKILVKLVQKWMLVSEVMLYKDKGLDSNYSQFLDSALRALNVYHKSSTEHPLGSKASNINFVIDVIEGL